MKDILLRLAKVTCISSKLGSACLASVDSDSQTMQAQHILTSSFLSWLFWKKLALKNCCERLWLEVKGKRFLTMYSWQVSFSVVFLAHWVRLWFYWCHFGHIEHNYMLLAWGKGLSSGLMALLYHKRWWRKLSIGYRQR